ncbi:MAG: hypothetical protein IPL61_03205 [Myxococcales bacterium]|nr:hypothetical protein [Myxococcales bacterium]
MPTPSFPAIEPSSLAAVTGGSSRAVTDERIMDKLTSITTTIRDVAAQQDAAKGNDPMSQMMPLVALKMMKRTQP